MIFILKDSAFFIIKKVLFWYLLGKTENSEKKFEGNYYFKLFKGCQTYNKSYLPQMLFQRIFLVLHF